MIVLGFDPGINGGMALVSNGDSCESKLMPTMGEGAQRTIDVSSIARWLKSHHIDFAVVEQVNGVPKWGFRNFRFGMTYGALLATLQLEKVPFETVRPTVWKKALRLSKSKEDARRRAIELFPRAASQFARKTVDDGRAEAALIAKYWLQYRMAPPARLSENHGVPWPGHRR